ncbi:hypothetical protein DEJ33_12895 [Curtobacterium sp. MCPF17_047]|nr:hypothetical protein DEJ24_12565 [Curtobacterium sp. MCPF17_001]PZF64008.1 hypothetical protein DEJ33_12895 [Curtobacterium sp. MCPF17_047]
MGSLPPGARCPVPGAWCLVPGAWCLVPGARCPVLSIEKARSSCSGWWQSSSWTVYGQRSSPSDSSASMRLNSVCR